MQKRALENPCPRFITDATVLVLNFSKSMPYNAQQKTSRSCWQFHAKTETDDQCVIMQEFRWIEELLMRLEYRQKPSWSDGTPLLSSRVHVINNQWEGGEHGWLRPDGVEEEGGVQSTVSVKKHFIG